MKSTHSSCCPSTRRHRFSTLLLTMTLALATFTSVTIPSGIAYGQGTSETKDSSPAKPAPAPTKSKDEEAKARTYAQTVSDWKSWANDHAYSFKSIQPETQVNGGIPSENFEDLSMLVPLLADKRIVYLGESSHGAAEFNLVKTRLIQYLHQELGFNIMAFESGLGDAAVAQGKMNSSTPEETMKRSIFGVWWTEETVPLFQYMKNTQDSKQPLRLMGFDIQLQTDLFKDAGWLKDKALKEKIIKTEDELDKWSNSKDLAGYRKVKPEYVKLYEKLLQEVKANKEALQKEYPNEPKIAMLMERMVQDRIKVIKEYIEINIETKIAMEKGNYMAFLKNTEWRDKAMAANLVWLATEVYPEERFIVWAHNGHISKAQSEIYQTPDAHKWMGELMPRDLQEMSYVIGLFMASGESAENNREAAKVQPLIPGSMEDILSAAKQPYTFMDVRYRDNERGNSWMFERVLAYDWGYMPMLIVPRRHFDGIVLIDKVKMPRYVK